MILPLEEAEPATSVRQVVHVVGSRLGEAVDLVDQLRNEGRADGDDDNEHDQVRDHDRRRTTDTSATFDQADERIERKGEEQCNHHPRQYVTGDPDHFERDRDGQHDQHDAQDRAGA